MNKNQTVVACVSSVSAVLAIVVPIHIVSTNSTERTRACVESGGEYLHVSDTTAMECRR